MVQNHREFLREKVWYMVEELAAGNSLLLTLTSLRAINGIVKVMKRRPWIKVLHKKQDYPDNYFDTDQFLNGLSKNCE